MPTAAPAPTQPPVVPTRRPVVPTPRPAPTRPPAVPTRRPVVPTAVPAPPAAVEAGTLLASEDFSSPTGWPSFTAANYSYGPRDRGYSITAIRGIGAVFAHGGDLLPRRTVLAADVTAQSGAAGLWFGPGKGYRFLLDTAGRYRVDAAISTVTPLVPPTKSAAIRRGTNQIQVQILDRIATLYINGVFVRRLVLAGSVQGTPAGFVVIGDTAAAQGRFDNFVVRAAR